MPAVAVESLETRCLLAASPLGIPDFRISDVGPEGDSSFDTEDPAIAYNSRRNEFLVVWSADESFADISIYGQRLNASTGEQIGDRIRISSGGVFEEDETPAVAYNPIADEYLVVWSGSVRNGDGGLGFEISGQRLSATGVNVGQDDFGISNMGFDTGASALEGLTPDVAFNTAENEYLVVWSGDNATNDEFEIYGQRLSAGGVELGVDDFAISTMGGTGDATFQALAPGVAYNATASEYLVVWQGDTNTGGLMDNEFEIFGQRLSGAGVEVGANDFRISTMGGTGDASFDALMPAVAHNPTVNEYLVAWHGDTNTGGLVDGENEIFVQRLAANGTKPVDTVNTRISTMGPPNDARFGAFTPAVAFNPTDGEYLVTWTANTNAGGLALGEFEIYGQTLGLLAQETGANDFRISHMGPDGNANFEGKTPAVAYGGTADEYLAVWSGDTNTGGLVDEEFEIFGQRLGLAPIVVTGAGPGGGPHLRVFDARTLTEKFGLHAYADDFRGGVQVATGDVNGDGTPDVITGPGPGGPPLVRIFNGATGSLIHEFLAYAEAFTGGVYVAAADLNGDGRAEIITGAGAGGGPHVRILDGLNGNLRGEYFAYAPLFSGGVRVATGDVDGDGVPDIIAGAGPGGGPHVRAFSGTDLTGKTVVSSFYAFAPNYNGGIFVAGGNVNAPTGVGPDEIIVGEGIGGYRARVFTSGGGQLAQVNAFVQEPHRSEVHVAAADVNTDGRTDLLLGSGPGDNPTRVRAIDFATLTELTSLTPYRFFGGGTSVAGTAHARGGSPQRAVGGAVTPEAGVTSLTQAALQPVVTAALTRFEQAGLSASGLARLGQVSVAVADLAGDRLGLALPGTVLLDVTAAGHGWFVDRTPLSDEEFHAAVGGRHLTAFASPAAGRMDLLSVVLHELGHQLGYGDLDPAAAPDHLMAATLAQGVRRLPTTLELDHAFADERFTEALLAPVL